ncbi:xanthine dehydrogenase family protein molybdopterin-binding subunit [Pimelobacter simplex]|uniref:xanthine dehydrogenase family protein molybdopterin-binding subunit n=1 Tax=Nocardioides simplex TaxID=2045 RepID=UPI00214FF8B2|nr:xanthine dehydrogenase family protein molybdopterin-binding subunit [Pimelobacter simplex]UUW91182.1 xanthine dehydrogenase family protein molybdopterin-binding subunit [Pimelobacter simplex]UUW95010.1 xanthine dehydrogenase family protein molybdopterin-binding subunit [Pimelobacter simplex]
MTALTGARFARVDGRAKASGAAVYTSDTRLDGMLEAAVVRSPVPRARVRGIDFTAALALDGVVAVLGPDEVADLHPVPVFPGMPANQRVLTAAPMYVGDAVAAVVARDAATAREAAALVELDLEELPPLLDPALALGSADELFAGVPGNEAGPPVELDRGDVDTAMAGAARVFVDEYRLQRQCAQTIEPMSCICDWSDPDRLEVITHLDNVFHFREQLAEMLGVAEHVVRITAPQTLGATFGLKNGILTSMEPLCAVLSRKTGAPVRLVLTAEESISTTVTRHSGTIRLTTGVDAEGTLLAREAEVLLDAGAYGWGSLVTFSMLGKWATLYRTEHLRFRGRGAYTNHVPAGAYRGVGTAQLHFAMESQIDDIARALGEDPLGYRLRHVLRVGDPLLKGTPVRALGIEECAERGAAAIGWNDRPAPEPDARFRRGYGAAFGLHHSGLNGTFPQIPERSSARARLQEDGRVVVDTAAIDKGQGTISTFAAIAADVFGVAIEDVAFSAIDSDTSPVDYMGAEASRTTYVAGRAVEMALQALHTKVVAAAGGTAPVGRAGLAALVAEVGVRDLVAEADFVPTDQDPLPVIGADFCEVEVDTWTGQVRVLRFVAAQDVGKVINELGCEGQIEGGAHHGIGYALTEELLVEDGQPVNGDFAGYRVLMAPEMPEIVPILVEHPDPEGGPSGSKGIGTGVIPAIAPAVCNAICDATGVRPTQLPVTPVRLLALIEAAAGHPA